MSIDQNWIHHNFWDASSPDLVIRILMSFLDPNICLESMELQCDMVRGVNGVYFCLLYPGIIQISLDSKLVIILSNSTGMILNPLWWEWLRTFTLNFGCIDLFQFISFIWTDYDEAHAAITLISFIFMYLLKTHIFTCTNCSNITVIFLLMSGQILPRKFQVRYSNGSQSGILSLGEMGKIFCKNCNVAWCSPVI